MSALELTGVTMRFGTRTVLEGLSVHIPLDAVTFIVGPSGAGKSVVCRLAVGLLKPDSGAISLLGHAVHTLTESRLTALRRQVPYLVQGPALLDALTLEANVALTEGGPEALSPLEALEQLGVADFAQRFPHEVGPGIQKRVAIARALRLRPHYLLLDEPTTGLDRRAARSVRDSLSTLTRRGLGALVVSHDFEFLRESADRVVVVGGGRVIFTGTRAEFLASSAPEVRALRDADAPERA